MINIVIISHKSRCHLYLSTARVVDASDISTPTLSPSLQLEETLIVIDHKMSLPFHCPQKKRKKDRRL